MLPQVRAAEVALDDAGRGRRSGKGKLIMVGTLAARIGLLAKAYAALEVTCSQAQQAREELSRELNLARGNMRMQGLRGGAQTMDSYWMATRTVLLAPG